MIQRKQSIYLLAGIVLSVAVLISGIFVVSNGVETAFLGAFGVQEGTLALDFPTMLPILILAILMVLIQGYALAMFKNRKLQQNLVMLNMLITVFVIAWTAFSYYQLTLLEVRVNPLSGAVHPLLIIFANFMALRGIKSDEALIKSVDRLR